MVAVAIFDESSTGDYRLNTMESGPLKKIAHFLFESGALAKVPRSYHPFLGYDAQSVAEHTNRVAYIAYALGYMAGDVNVEHMVLMALFHDFAEARTSDLNYIQQQYVESDEVKAIDEMTSGLPFGQDILKRLTEYKTRRTRESQLVKDADQLEFILSLKEQMDLGNPRAPKWLPSAIKRLKTSEGQQLAEMILETGADEWWFLAKDESWWVNRTGAPGHDKRF